MCRCASSVATVDKVRDYPLEPRVGVGVVILRNLDRPEVLLIRRAKEPNKGYWSVCGGSQELGETLVECAVREALEETGLRLLCPPLAAGMPGRSSSPSLEWPTPFTAVDVITKDTKGTINYHYSIVEVAARLENPSDCPVPAGDVDACRWFDVGTLGSSSEESQKLVPNLVSVIDEAVRRFHFKDHA